MIHVVFDTNVLVLALWSPQGKPAQLFALMLTEKITPCYDYQIMAEYQAVLKRPRLRFSGAKTEAVLSEIERYGISVIAPRSNIEFIDESDRKFYDVALACNAFLITGNARHYPDDRFIATPANFLSDIENLLRLDSML